MMQKLAVLILLAASAGAASAPDALTPLRPLAGAWTGQMTCKTGNYGTAANLAESRGGMVVRYNSVSGGPAPMRANGQVSVSPAPKGTFIAASSQGVSVKVSLAEKGQVLIFEPDPASTGLAALIQFSGTARLDKKRTKAVLRFTVASPLGPDSCMGSMAKKAR
jgi:hypothetical protein